MMGTTLSQLHLRGLYEIDTNTPAGIASDVLNIFMGKGHELEANEDCFEHFGTCDVQ
jgi:hypothetical protein